MIVRFTIDDAELRAVLLGYAESKIGGGLDIEKLDLRVRSTQNYRNKEWEPGEMRITYEGEIIRISESE